MGGIAGTSGPGYAGVDRGSLVVFGSMRPSPRRLFFSPLSIHSSTSVFLHFLTGIYSLSTRHRASPRTPADHVKVMLMPRLQGLPG